MPIMSFTTRKATSNGRNSSVGVFMQISLPPLASMTLNKLLLFNFFFYMNGSIMATRKTTTSLSWRESNLREKNKICKIFLIVIVIMNKKFQISLFVGSRECTATVTASASLMMLTFILLIIFHKNGDKRLQQFSSKPWWWVASENICRKISPNWIFSESVQLAEWGWSGSF